MSTNPFEQQSPAPSSRRATPVHATEKTSHSQWHSRDPINSPNQPSPRSRSRYTRDYYPNDDFPVYDREDDNGEQQINNIKQQIRNVKQESLQSSRNALQQITQSRDVAGQTMEKLGEQASQLASIDRDLDTAKEHAREASYKTDELHRLNRSIFIPNIKNPFTRKARKRREEAARQEQQDEQRQAKEENRQFEAESRARLGRPVNPKSAPYHQDASTQRQRYQFEPDEEDDAIERELDDNMDAISNTAGALKQMAAAMGDELDSQNAQLKKMSQKTDPISDQLMATTYRLDRIK